jgi:aspartate/methionine/tyrosine aminotransferase
MNINTHFRELRNNYFFVDVLNKSHAYARLHPDAKILHLGIGDVTMPLPVVLRYAAGAMSSGLYSGSGIRRVRTRIRAFFRLL